MPRRVMKSPTGANQDGTAFFLSVITRMPNRSMADPRNSEKKAEAAVMKEAYVPVSDQGLIVGCTFNKLGMFRRRRQSSWSLFRGRLHRHRWHGHNFHRWWLRRQVHRVPEKECNQELFSKRNLSRWRMITWPEVGSHKFSSKLIWVGLTAGLIWPPPDIHTPMAMPMQRSAAVNYRQALDEIFSDKPAPHPRLSDVQSWRS